MTIIAFFAGLTLGALGYWLIIRKRLAALELSARTLTRVCRGELS